MRKWLIIPLILIVSLGISATPKAQAYYSAAMSAMQQRDCRNALQWFEKALLEDPSIEDVDPYIKLWIGICAYEIGNYSTAKDFLKFFPNNEIAKTILDRINRGLSPEEREWDEIKSLIMSEKSALAGTTPRATNTKENGKATMTAFLGLFIFMFSSFLILEIKYGTVSKMMAKIPRVKIVIGNAQVVKQVVHETMTETKEESEKEEAPQEKEVELDIDKLFNSPLATVDKLIYGDEFAPEGLEEEEETQKSEIAMVAQELGSAEEVPTEEKNEEREQEEKEVEEAGKEEEAKEEQEKVEEETEEEKVEEETEEEVKEAKVEEEEEKEVVKSEGESLTEEDLEEVRKKAKELLNSEEEEEEEGISVEIASMDAEDILQQLEEKDEYNEEDAEKLLFAIQKLIEGEGSENDEEGEG